MARDSRFERPVLDPELVATQAFSTTFRGFDTAEVRGYLRALAGLLHDAAVREAELFRRVAEAEERAANPPPLDEQQLTALLGEETARVLDSARRAAADIKARAEEQAGQLIVEANAEATATRSAAEEQAAGVRAEADQRAERVRAEAQEVLAMGRSAAEAEAAQLRADAEAEAARLLGRAEAVLAERTKEAEDTAASIRAEVGTLRAETDAELQAQRERVTEELDGLRQRAAAEAAAEVEAAKISGRSMVEEARALRTRMLSNLAERRRVGRAQLDQLRVTREELLSALASVKLQIDTAATDIAAALPAARATTEETGRRDAEDEEKLAAMLAAPPEGPAIEPAAAGEPSSAAREGAAAPETAEAEAGALPSSETIERPRGAADPPLIDLTAGPATEADPAGPGPRPGSGAGVQSAGSAGTTVVEDAAPPPAPPAAPPERPRRRARAAAPAEVTTPGSSTEATLVREPTDEAQETGHPADIDALFAKIRDARQRTVADARSVLADVPLAAPREAVDLTGAVDVPEGEEPVDLTGTPPDAAEVGASEDAGAVALTATPDAAGVGASEAAGAVALTATPADPLATAVEPTAPEDPTGTPEAAAGTDPPATTADGGPEVTASARPALDPSADDPTAAEREAADGELTGGQAEAASESDPGAAAQEASTALLDRRDGATDAIERRLSRRLKRVLSDEQNEMLDLVRRTRGVPTAERLLPDREAHAGRYAEAAAEDLAGAAAVGWQFYGDSSGAATTVVDDIAEQLAAELVGQLRGRLDRCFEDSQGDESELGERIRACYREWKTQRIADTSRHFVLGAFTRGLFDAAPDGTAFRWVVDDGGTPCPDAEDNRLGGEVAKGDPFPTGDVYPPAHPGCRCLIVPTVDASAIPVTAAP